LDDDLIKQTISSYNLVNALINPEDNSNFLQDIKFDGNLYLSTNAEKDNALKEFIKSLNSENVSNIDINEFNDLPNDIKGKWDDDDFLPKLYKVIGIQCAKIEDCKNQFQYEDEQSINDISFNIVRYTYDDGNTSNYAFIIINDKSKNVYHAFTLESDENEKFTLNEKDSTYNSITYEYINDYYVINSENIKKRKENEIIVEKGIGLLAESGLIYEDDQYLYEPDYYGYQNDDTDLDDEELKKELNELNEKISQTYDIKKDEGTYNSNMIINIFNFDLVSVNPVEDTENDSISFVKSKSQDDNILCSYTNEQLAHIEKLALRFLEARKYYNIENNINIIESSIYKRDDDNIDLLPFLDIYIINRLFEIISLKKIIKYDGGIFHYCNDSELINDYTEYIITQNMLFNIDTNINMCNDNNECSINSSIIVDFDIKKSYKNIIEIGKKHNLMKRLYPFDYEIDASIPHESITEDIKRKIEDYKRTGFNLSPSTSEMLAYDLYHFIGGLKSMYGKSEYKDAPLFKYIDEKEIVRLEALHSTFVNLHNKNFETTNLITNLNLRDYTPTIEPNSKYTYDKFYDLLSSFNELIYINNPDDDGTHTRIEFDNNGEVKNIENIISTFKNLKIDKNLKEYIKLNIIKLTEIAKDLEIIYDKNNKGMSRERYVENSSLVYGMKDALNTFLVNNYTNENGYIEDETLNKFVGMHQIKKDLTNSKYEYSNENVKIKFEDICKTNLDEILNDPNGIKYLNQYSDLIKAYIKTNINNNGGKLSEDLRKNVENLRDRIVSKIENVDDHYENAIKIPALMNAFNDIANTIKENLNNDENIDNFRGLYLENFQNLETRLKYVSLDYQYEAIDRAIKDNPKSFKLPDNCKTFKDYVKQCHEQSDEKETFDFNDIYYFTPSDLDAIMTGDDKSNIMLEMKKNGNLESVSDCLKGFSRILSNGESNDELINLEKYSEIQYHILNNHPSIKREDTDIKNMETTSRLLNSNRLLKGNSMNPTENDKISYERNKENMIYYYNLSELNRYLNYDRELNENERENILQNCKSNDDIFNRLKSYNIYNGNNNQKIINFNNNYKFINPNEIAGDDTTDDDIYNMIYVNMERYYGKYAQSLENQITKMDTKNKLELRNNCERVSGGIYDALKIRSQEFYKIFNENKNIDNYNILQSSKNENHRIYLEKMDTINSLNKMAINENFLNSVECCERLGGQSLIKFENQQDKEKFEQSFKTPSNINPYNLRKIQNQNGNHPGSNHSGSNQPGSNHPGGSGSNHNQNGNNNGNNHSGGGKNH